MIMIYCEVCNDNFLFSHLLHVIGNMSQSMNLSCAIKMLTKDFPFHENILSLEASVLINKYYFVYLQNSPLMQYLEKTNRQVSLGRDTRKFKLNSRLLSKLNNVTSVIL